MPRVFRIRVRCALLRPLAEDQRHSLLTELPQARISATEIAVDLDLSAETQARAVEEGLAHTFAIFDKAGLDAGDDYSLETFTADANQRLNP